MPPFTQRHSFYGTVLFSTPMIVEGFGFQYIKIRFYKFCLTLIAKPTYSHQDLTPPLLRSEPCYFMTKLPHEPEQRYSHGPWPCAASMPILTSFGNPCSFSGLLKYLDLQYNCVDNPFHFSSKLGVGCPAEYYPHRCVGGIILALYPSPSFKPAVVLLITLAGGQQDICHGEGSK